MKSLWHHLTDAPPRPPLEGRAAADVAVIGAGLCGLSCAYHLAGEGLRVALLEGERIGYGASGRNVGFLLGGTAESHDRTASLFGRRKAREMYQATVDNHRLLAEVIETEEIPCEYLQRGSLHLASSPDEAAEVRRSVDLLVEDGFDATYLDGGQLPAWAREAGYLGGALHGEDGELDPYALCVGLARAVEEREALIHEGAAVTAVDSGAEGFVVRANGGEVHCDAVVAATNAWTRALLPAQGNAIEPQRGQVLATDPVPGEPVFDVPVYANHGFEYFRQMPSGRVVLGGWRNIDVSGENTEEVALNDAIQGNLEAYLRRVHPALADVPVTHRWAGIMGFSSDGMPLVGQAPGTAGLLVAAGFTGHGMGLAFLAGAVIRDLLLHGVSAWQPLFDPRRV